MFDITTRDIKYLQGVGPQRATAVSYTHLDVYKRQVLLCGTMTGPPMLSE